tara:strand:+ start:3465 stop:4100 length:636 start_codon:yes stop_codon:yes gene_type:complete
MKKIPFFSNIGDGTYCYLAVLKMILKYYCPQNDYSWENLIELTGKKEGLWTWPQYSYISMKNLGFDVKIISSFDYDKFADNGYKYLEDTYGKEVAEGQRKHSDLDDAISTVKKIKKILIQETRIPSVQDIIQLLSKGYLVECGINSYMLESKEGYAEHSILIFHSEKNIFTIHDPGFPPKESRKVPTELFEKAWAYPNAESKNITAFKHIK